jgi:serine O-acetyltransferase
VHRIIEEYFFFRTFATILALLKTMTATATAVMATDDEFTATAVMATDDEFTTAAAVRATDDGFTERIFREAKETLAEEPELSALLHLTVLAPWVMTFEDAVAATMCYRMLLHPQNGQATVVDPSTGSCSTMFCPSALRGIFQKAFLNQDSFEMGHTMKEAVRKDAMAIIDRDPACETLLEVVLFYKGFAALVVHRAARQKWLSRKRSMTALFLQHQASAIFAVDIHPAATIGAGILLDHGTGIVIGETAHLGDGCTMLHGVTRGGNGKDTGDRHPKVGKHVLIGAGASILGNISIGDRAKIGAGSIVLRPIPPGATAVGAPARIIGKTLEEDPATLMDENLHNVGLFHKSGSTVTLSTAAESSSGSSLGGGGDSSSSTFSDDDASSPSSACPYRDYAKFVFQIAKKAPRNSITYCKLAKCLKAKGCSRSEIFALFFALDTRNVGYVYQKDVNPEVITKMLMETTPLDAQQVGAVLQELAVA